MEGNGRWILRVSGEEVESRTPGLAYGSGRPAFHFLAYEQIYNKKGLFGSQTKRVVAVKVQSLLGAGVQKKR